MHRFQKTFFVAALVAGWMPLDAIAQDGPQAKLKTAQLTAGMHVIHAELAISPDEQATGLMFRRGMGANDGMLFVYTDSAQRCFAMRNTWVPLTIAFIEADGTIVNFADMKPMDPQSRCSEKPVQYALEVPQAWFAKRGFTVGLKLRGAAFDKP
jgi:uncharacterized protein